MTLAVVIHWIGVAATIAVAWLAAGLTVASLFARDEGRPEDEADPDAQLLFGVMALAWPLAPILFAVVPLTRGLGALALGIGLRRSARPKV